jgi:hypothetical protein
MVEVLRRLSEAEEMKPLLAQAPRSGGTVAIEVFQSRNGQPILIRFAKETILEPGLVFARVIEFLQIVQLKTF